MTSNDAALRLSPTLVIGLGGTGSLAVQYAKQAIQRRLLLAGGDGSIPPFISFFVIDTASEEPLVARLGGDEFLNIGHRNLSRVIRDLRVNPEPTMDWFPLNLDPGQIDAGAGGVRAIGRLCFFLAKSTIDRRLREKVRVITEYSRTHAWAERTAAWALPVRVPPSVSIDVHIVSSICGGTGSACILDTAYLIKHVVSQDAQLSVRPTGHLVTVEPFDGEPIGNIGREYIRDNALVTFAEIEHFVRHGSWNVAYPDESVVTPDVREKPFGFTFLLGNSVGRSLSRKAVTEMIGEAIGFATVAAGRHTFRNSLDNLRTRVVNKHDRNGRPKAYSSYGLARLPLALTDDMLGAANRMAVQTIVRRLTGSVTSAPAVDVDRMLAAAVAESFAANELGANWLENQFSNEFAITATRLNGAANAVARRDTGNINLGYEQTREELHQIRQALEVELRQRFAAFRREIDRYVDSALRHGGTLDTARSLLGQAQRCLQALLITVNGRLDVVQREGDSNAMARAIERRDAEAYGRAAAATLRQDVYGPLLGRLGGQISAIDAEFERRRTACARAEACLTTVARATAGDDMSPELDPRVGAALEHDPRALVSVFLDLVRVTAAGGPGGDVPAFYLERLDHGIVGRSAEVARLLAEAAMRVTTSATHGLSASEDVIRERVEAAQPIWQLEPKGGEVTDVSVACGPEGQLSSRAREALGKDVSFINDPGTGPELFIFRSAHGVSAAALLSLQSCVAAAQRRLTDERKATLNELCLDPRWKIADPIEIDNALRWFALGCYVQVVKLRGRDWVVSGDQGAEGMLLKAEIGQVLPRRALASRRFGELAGSDQARYARVKRDIDEWLRKRADPTPHKLVADLRGYVTLTLPQLMKHCPEDEGQIQDELTILREEIRKYEALLAAQGHPPYGSDADPINPMDPVDPIDPAADDQAIVGNFTTTVTEREEKSSRIPSSTPVPHSAEH